MGASVSPRAVGAGNSNSNSLCSTHTGLIIDLFHKVKHQHQNKVQH